MQNSMVMFTFSVFDRGYVFCANLVQKNLNCQFKAKLYSETNWFMQNSMVMFTFFVFGRKYSVWDIAVQKIEIDNLRWNLIPRLIRICWIQWCCSLFSFLTGNVFLGQIWSKLSIFTVFLFPIRNPFFWTNVVQNVKIVSLKADFSS